MTKKYTVDAMIENIASIYKQSDESERYSGSVWYDSASKQALEISKDTGIDYGKIVYCIAALSPRNRWERNIQDVFNLSRVLSAEVSCGTFNANKQKALQCLLGTDFEFKRDIETLAIKGYKVKSFARLIYNPLDFYSVCIDTHAIGIAHGHRYSVDDKHLLCGIFGNKSRYDSIAQAYRELAYTLELLPHQLQAITWLVWKRIHKV
jgi:hypothetical protein